MSMMGKMQVVLGVYVDADVRHVLHVDHARMRALAAQLVEAGSSKRRRGILKQLQSLWAAHSRAEEAVVYDALIALRNLPTSRQAGAEGIVEHGLIETVLSRLANTSDVSSDMWIAHASVLRESLEHHIDEEESTIYEELGEYFSSVERTHMAIEFHRRKQEQFFNSMSIARRSAPPAANAGRRFVVGRTFRYEEGELNGS